MKCEYCGTDEQTGSRCDKCGAPLPEKHDKFWKSEPFFYNGYICYTLRDLAADTAEVQFWLGRELIQRIKIPYQWIVENSRPGEDHIHFFWELFLVAHGEKEVLEYQEKNSKYPAMFRVTRLENPEKERIRGLSLRDLAYEFVK